MPLNKPALLALNQTNFPDNTQQLITPVLLRDFNTQMIASMELTQSMSDYAVLNGGNAFIGSQSIDGYVSIDKTKALNTNAIYWNNNTVGYTNLEIINSASGNLDLSAKNGKIRIITSSLDIMNGTFTASLQDGYTYVGNGSGRTQAVSTSSFASNINTGSFLTTSSFNAYTSSNDTKWNTLGIYTASVDTQFVAVGSSTSSLNSATASLFTSASLALVTASFSGNTLTFTKGNNTTFGVTIPDISGSTIPAGTISGSSQITALGFVSSSVTGSSLITGSVSGNTLTFTKGDATQFSLTVATGSGGGSTDTGSLMVTGSVNVNVLTFTKGDGSTFDLTVAASGSSPAGTVSSSQQILNYNIFATTGSNDFVGTQNISSSGDGITLLGYSNRLNFGATQNSDRAWFNLAQSDGTNQGTALQFAGVNTGVSFAVGDSETPSTGSTPVAFENTSRSGSILFQNSGNTGQIRFQNNTGSINLQAGNSILISGSLTRIQDVNFIPFSASLNSRILAATGSSINTGSFATTGSNTFSGSQTINGGNKLFIQRSTTGANNLLRLGATDNENNFAFIVTGSDTNPGQQVWGISVQGGTWGNSFDAGVVFNSYVTASQGLNVGDAGTFSAPLQNGYVWVGNSSGRNTTAPTSSFGGSTDTGSLMRTGSVSGNVLTFTKGDASTFTLTVATGSGGSTIDTGSFATTGSNTFVGNQTIQNADLRISGSILFPNSAEIRGNAGTQTTFTSLSSLAISCSVNATIAASDLTLNATIVNVRGVETIGDIASTSNGEVYLLGRSGSLVIGNSSASPTYAALAHLSSSQINGNTNLIFKTNGSTGDTIISGSSNIFTNPSTPTTGYKRYIGGSNNLYLNQTNGINSQITASAASVSGARPVMNNNIFAGNANFALNYASNAAATQNISSNITAVPAGNSFTINALAHTGSMDILGNLTMGSNGGITNLNPSSASIAEIALGLSGSGQFNYYNNINNNATINITSNRNIPSATVTNTLGNIVTGGSLTVTNISSSAQVNANSNIANSTMTYSNAGAAGLALHRTTGTMNTNYGAMSLIASASAIQASNNISPASMTVTNRMFSGSLGSGSLTFANNQTQGGSNTYTITGSFGGTGSPAMQANGIFGASNTLFTNVEGRGNYVDVRNNLIGGTFLILTGSNNLATTGSGGGYFGRFNANDGLRNGTGENILVVGTGTSEANRKTGFLIDSGSNTFVEGSLNVSGSTAFTGSISIAPTFQAKFATGSNQQAGTAVLDGANPGAVVVSNSLVTANSIIMLTKQTLTNSHMVAVSSKGAGTFTILSTGNGDTDTVGWFIINNS